MRLLLIFCAVAVSRAEQSPAERLIEAGQRKQARSIVEGQLREAPGDALSNFVFSQAEARSATGRARPEVASTSMGPL
jgi:hypothetical protein